MGKGNKLQRMAIVSALEINTGTRGECALCEHILVKISDHIVICKDCHAVYVVQENGLLDYIGRRAA